MSGLIFIVLAAPLPVMWAVMTFGPFLSGAIFYDRQYDRMVNTLIRGGMLELSGSHTVKSGALSIWVSNYPYAYGHPYDCGVNERLSLAPWTKRRLRKHVRDLSTLRALEKARSAA